MAQRKTADKDKTQRQRFIEAARKLGADESEGAFDRALGKVASAPPPASVESRKSKAKKKRAK